MTALKRIELRDASIRTFLTRFERGNERDCWPWKGHIDDKGYGTFFDGRKTYLASRISWFLANGLKQPSGFVCHSCDNPQCVNPAHLWIGTQRDNMHDMIRKGRHVNVRKTHCSNGHPFDEENTYLHYGQRHCRACDRAKKRIKRSTRDSGAANNRPETDK